MGRVVPRYVPADSIEDRLGYLVTAVTPEGARRYLGRDHESWGGAAEALFFEQALEAADALKEARAVAETAEAAGPVEHASIQLVRVLALLVPTEISQAELRKRRKEAALAKLTADEIEALGLGPDGEPISRTRPQRPIGRGHE